MTANLPGDLDPFLLLTNRLLILPTMSAVHHRPYLDMYADLHASPDFCMMGFGPHWPARQWDEEERLAIVQREIERSWKFRGIGDFAVGLWGGTTEIGTRIDNDTRLIRGHDLEILLSDSSYPKKITWIGYAGVRDATTTSLPSQTEGDPPFPPWTEMVEIRYGVAPSHWGHGYAPEAARAVMSWAAKKRNISRFIAETEKANERSGGVLKKIGFIESHTNYWKEPSEMEWERIPA